MIVFNTNQELRSSLSVRETVITAALQPQLLSLSVFDQSGVDTSSVEVKGQVLDLNATDQIPRDTNGSTFNGKFCVFWMNPLNVVLFYFVSLDDFGFTRLNLRSSIPISQKLVEDFVF